MSEISGDEYMEYVKVTHAFFPDLRVKVVCWASAEVLLG